VEVVEERVCSVKIVAAELWDALLVEAVLWAHFQGAAQKDRGRSYAEIFELPDRRLGSSEVSFQALSVIVFARQKQEMPCLLSGWRRSGTGSDYW
jgi:hypothetical protein